MKDNFLLGGVVILAIIVGILALLLLVTISYGFLIGINYFLTEYELVAMQPFNIEITHVLLTAIFISISVVATSNYGQDIRTLEKSLSAELFSLHRTVEEMSFKFSELEEIRMTLNSIDGSLDEIKFKE